MHPDGVKNDNFGTWKHSGSHPQTYRVQVEGEDGYVHFEKCAPGTTGDDAVDLPRFTASILSTVISSTSFQVSTVCYVL